jgi:uncharacterized protein YprB with RNaseH-like and TPR domain
MNTYLDIETSFSGEISVIGIYHENGPLIQLVGDEVSGQNLLTSLKRTSTIVTYNGIRFDLPVIKNRLGTDLKEHFHSSDLMYECWRQNLYGGLKKVEEQLGITRNSQGIDGWEAMRLWERYRKNQDFKALKTLLDYNRDDVINLPILEKKLFP